MSSQLVVELPDEALRSGFDSGTLLRGRTYASEGRVLELSLLEEDDDYAELEAVVKGTGTPYRTVVAVMRHRRGWSVSSDCSCPVGNQCKHGVAVVLTARRASGSEEQPQQPDWARRLDAVLAGLEGGTPDPAAVPLALQVELGTDYSGLAVCGTQPLTVRVRPLRRGARGAWVKGGASWPEIAALSQHADGGTVDRRHAAALRDVAALRNTGLYYGHPAGGAALAEFGPGVWPALREAVDAGVALVGGGGLQEVSLSDDPVDVALDVARDATVDEGPFLVQPHVVTPDGRRWSRDEVVPLPGARGVALLSTGDARGPATRLLLAPLARRLEPSLWRLLGDPDPFLLPPEAATALVEDYLPRLQQHLDLTSLNGSVVLPERAVPTARLVVRWGGRGEVGLRWRWSLAQGRGEQVTAMSRDDVVPGLDEVDDPQDLLREADGRLRAEVDLREDQLPGFVQDLLPRLRAQPGLEVVDEGTPLDYRSALSEPEIRFEAAAPTAAPGADEDAPTDLTAPTDWLDLHVVITVDGHDVPLPALLTAMTLGEPVVILDDGLLVWAGHPALTRLAEAVRSAAELRPTRAAGRGEDDRDEIGDAAVRVGRGDLGLWAELSDLGAVDAQASRWVDAARTLAGFSGLPDVDPPGVASELRSYQRDGFRWLAFLRECGLGGILADDMGLGKTLQSLAAISHARAAGSGPFLVVAPTSVVGNWVLEAARHTPGLVVRAVGGSAAKRGTTVAQEAADADVLVTSYTLLRLDVEQYAGVAWGGLVLDEAHQVKNHRGKTYEAVRCLDADFRLALTGTPVENRLGDMWSLLSIVAPGLYPDRRGFTEHVASPVEKRGDADALARFRTRVRPFLLRRTKEHVAADLPPKQEQVLDVVLAPAHRRLYDARMQRERQAILGLLDDFDGNQVAIFAALTRLRQLSLHAGLVDPDAVDVASAKLDQLVEHLREVAAEGHRALVFSQFTRFLRLAQQRLAAEGIECVYLDGGTRDRQAAVAEFREGDAPAFLISLKAGGMGLTLTEADYVFVLDPWWNPAVEAQAVDRAHRIGQTRPVLVYRLVAVDTIEEKVMALKARKAALVEGVLGDAAGLGEVMSAADVRAMLEP